MQEKQSKPMVVLGGEKGYGDDESISTKKIPECLSLSWNADGKTLFAGFSDG